MAKPHLRDPNKERYRSLNSRGVTYVACWAHCRRKFYEVRERDPVLAHEALARMRQLYSLEASVREASEEGGAEATGSGAAVWRASGNGWRLNSEWRFPRAGWAKRSRTFSRSASADVVTALLIRSGWSVSPRRIICSLVIAIPF